MEQGEIAENIDKISDNSRKKRFRFLVIISTIILTVLIGFAVYFYFLIYGQNLPKFDKDKILLISSDKDLNQIADLLQHDKIISKKENFIFVSKLMKFKGKSGRYKITKSTRSYHKLISILRGAQEPVNITFNNLRFLHQLAGQVDNMLEADSIRFLNAFLDSNFLKKNGFNPETALTMYIPETYNINWDIKPEKFVERMHREYTSFWKKDKRLEKAKQQNLSPTEVYILASIVDAETTYIPEKPRVAGVYLNRLRKKGWKLEADPTVVFANGDFNVKRVTNELLKIDSPYNTYKYPGLPPGPIRMASISAIDAVLNAEEHDYWFFCARPPVEGEPNQHAFAKNGSEHAMNANLYRRWLNSNKIYR